MSDEQHFPEHMHLKVPALVRELLVNTFLLRRLNAEAAAPEASRPAAATPSQPAAAPSVEAEIAAARQRLAARKETMSETRRVNIVDPTVLPVDERVGVRGQYRVGGAD
jgi:hypothetical protein